MNTHAPQHAPASRFEPLHRLTLYAERDKAVQPLKVIHGGNSEYWTCTATYPRAAVRKLFRGYNLRSIIDATWGSYHSSGAGRAFVHSGSARTRGPLLIIRQSGGLDI